MKDSNAPCKTQIGRNTFIGEGTIVMSNVCDHCVVEEGAVVIDDIEDYCLAVGNPAKVFIKRDEAR